MTMNDKTGIKEFFGPTRRDYIESIGILGYFIIANIWCISTYPELLPSGKVIVVLAIAGAIGGLLVGGMKGLFGGAFFLGMGFALINGAFFPIYFIGYLAGLVFAFLSTIPLPLIGNVGAAILYGLFTLVCLFIVIGRYSRYKHRKEDNRYTDYEDYSSPTFTMTLWGGRWG
jgi:hypothetical protein